MNIVFEFKDKNKVVFLGLQLHKINERTPIHDDLDACLSDPELINMYIFANDNWLE